MNFNGDKTARLVAAEDRVKNRNDGGDFINSVAEESPSADFCCKLATIGFVWVYREMGQYWLSAYVALITILFAQLCFQSAACGALCYSHP